MKRRQLKGPEVEKEEIKFPLFVDGLADYVEEYSTLLELIMKFGMIPGFRIEEKTNKQKKPVFQTAATASDSSKKVARIRASSQPLRNTVSRDCEMLT